MVGTIILSFALPFADPPAELAPRDALFLVVLGLLAGLGHWFLISAFLLAPASLIAPFTYLQMIWATMYGYFVFGQLPDGLSPVGMGVIVASGVAGCDRHPGRCNRSHGPGSNFCRPSKLP